MLFISLIDYKLSERNPSLIFFEYTLEARAEFFT